MKTDDFDYVLPPELIAQQPADRRDGSRMMVVHKNEQRWEHRMFTDLPSFLHAGDVVVVNNTRVIPARLIGHKPGTGGKVEVFLLEEITPDTWHVLLRARRRPAVGDKITLGEGNKKLTAVMLAEGELGKATVKFESDQPVLEWAAEHGETPLPPYIRRDQGNHPVDQERYQTLFARHPGAVAAPTAGLHFTPEILQQLESMGVSKVELTLHVGIGTFRPVTADQVADHRMADERFEISVEAAEKIRAARTAGGRCLAVGSTSVRTLETVATQFGNIQAASGRTGLFIYPPYDFKITDMILTNFHLPKSTLLMMMSAFASRELVLAAYADAVKERYRFFSYGDCMLIV